MSDRTDTSGAQVDLLGDFLKSMFAYYHRHLKPEVEKLYRKGLAGIPVNFLEEAFAEHLKVPETSKHPSPPSIAIFVTAWQAKRRQETREEEYRHSGDITRTLTPDEEARRLLIAHCALRIGHCEPKEEAPEIVVMLSRWAAAEFQKKHPNPNIIYQNPLAYAEEVSKHINAALKLFDEEINSKEAIKA